MVLRFLVFYIGHSSQHGLHYLPAQGRTCAVEHV